MATCGIVCCEERIACRTRNSNSVLPETVGAPVSIVEFNSSLPVRKLQKRCCSGNLGTYRSGSNGCAIPSAGFLWMFTKHKATSIHRLLLPTGRKDIQEDRFVSSTVTRRDQPSATRCDFPAVHIWKLQNHHDVWPKARAV